MAFLRRNDAMIVATKTKPELAASAPNVSIS